MKPDCRHDCKDDWIFPKRPDNRPGLDKINYRIAEYADFRETILRSLNKNPVLEHWTHREADDPGIALLEGAAMLGDILTFYQDLYANEAYLRTAQWRESIAELVRLLGYRLSPGLGGKATFAFEVEGNKEVSVPKGFQVKVDLEKLSGSVEFESIKEVKAYPDLSKFYLYRPMQDPNFNAQTKEFYIYSTFPASETVDLQKENRLLLGIPEPASGTPVRIKNAQIVMIDSIRELQEVKIFKIKGAVKNINVPQVVAYKLGRTFNHFGHNSPPQSIKLNSNGDPVPETVSYTRKLSATTTQSVDPYILANYIPLDKEVDNLALGNPLIFQGKFEANGASSVYIAWLTLLGEIESLRKETYTWGALTGACSVVKLKSQLIITINNKTYNQVNIKQLQILETIGPRLTLRAAPKKDTSTLKGKILYFYGTTATALALKNRKLFIQTENGKIIEASVNSVKTTSTQEKPFAVQASSWELSLSAEVDYNKFSNEKPLTIVFGNLVEMTQGKTEKEKPLGNGDSRQVFQTFKLPKSPLTYLPVTGSTPPEVPELKIYVDNQLWKRVPTLYGQGPKDEVYIVREDENNNSFVQFGDGKTGARLPSGLNNVVAKYRTGIGAYGEIKTDTQVQATDKLDKLKKIYMPDRAALGSQPEEGKKAKQAGPGKTQSLGRLVSLKDYESEALGISGVAKVQAEWGLEDNSPSVKLKILMESGQKDKLEDVQDLMDGYNQSIGPNRYPLIVEPGRYQYVYISITAAVDKHYQQLLVKKDIMQALGVSGEEENGIDGSEGLFGIKQRRFGQDEFDTKVLGVVQNVSGVVWVKITTFVSIGWPDNPAILDLNEVVYNQKRITAWPQDILALHTKQLKINLVEAKFKGDCV